MTVAELIRNLSSLPQDSVVVIEAKLDFQTVKTLLPLQPTGRVLLVPGEEDEEEVEQQVGRAM